MQAAGDVAVVGLVSDTHGVLELATIDALKGRAIDAIIHAGDVGDKHKKLRLSAAQIIQRLEESTRNTRIIAVAGNVDEGVSDLPLTQVVTMAGVRILVMHICGFPPKVSQDSQQLIDTISPQIVVFGHSHVPGVQWHNNILYVNPGSAGPRRFKLPRCIAFLSLHASGIVEVEFTPVATLPQDLEGLPQPLIQNMVRCGSV